MHKCSLCYRSFSGIDIWKNIFDQFKNESDRINVRIVKRNVVETSSGTAQKSKTSLKMKCKSDPKTKVYQIANVNRVTKFLFVENTDNPLFQSSAISIQILRIHFHFRNIISQYFLVLLLPKFAQKPKFCLCPKPQSPSNSLPY